ncbi:MAG TPA: DUF6502 family protein [Burkholderiaceae bacterium]|nr:DUF6502 family protein [Burkholderiaceae bacterium]
MKTANPDPDKALTLALERLLAPLAGLCLAHGLSYQAAAELLKRAYVHAARAAQPDGSGKRDVSRVSTTTGLTRREVTRITREVAASMVLRPSPATQVFTRWMGNKRLHDKRGRPRALKRQGPAPSFESLARSVTRDVHPRSLLEELCRLGLARLDAKTDSVVLVRDAFVPSDDRSRMFGFLGNNVGDHLAAAVSNVLGKSEPHLEQAIFADELSLPSLAKVRKLVVAQWKVLLTALVPEIQALIESDRKARRAADQRLRVGLYSYHAPMGRTEKDGKES